MKTEKKKFSIEISGEFFCQGMEMTGKNPGKTLVVTAGVHGREYVGIQTLFTFAEDILREEINGRLILIPVVNEEGFYQGSRQIVPADGINLNRAFPGDIHGTRTWRLAAALETCLYPKADFLLDLHGGDDNEMAMAFVYFSACAGTGVTEASRRAASSLSVSVRTASDPQVQGKASRNCIVLYHCVRSKGRRRFGGNRKIRKPLAAERAGRDAMTNKDYPDPEKCFLYL